MTQQISNLALALPVVLWRGLAGCVTGVRVLDFPKIEIDRKPQKIFQILLSLWLKHRGNSTEERKVL